MAPTQTIKNKGNKSWYIPMLSSTPNMDVLFQLAQCRGPYSQVAYKGIFVDSLIVYVMSEN